MGRPMWVMLWCVCHRPCDQKADDTFFRQLEEASHLQALVLMGALTILDICWKCNTAGPKQPRKFLKCIDGYFMTEVIDKLTRAGALLSFTYSQEKKWLVAALAAVTKSWWHSWMNKDLLTKPKCKKKANMRWKQSQVTQEHAQLERVREPSTSKPGKKYNGQQVSTSVSEAKGRHGKM